MAANYPTDTPRERMLGASWNFEKAQDARDRRARRRREKAGWQHDADAVSRDTDTHDRPEGNR